MDDLSTPGKRLRDRRLKAGYLTAAELARAIGKPNATVNQHETGIRGITPAMARKYARRLRITPEWLLFGDRLNQVTENTALSDNANLVPDRVPVLECSDMEQFHSIVAGAIPMSDYEVFAPQKLGAGKRTFVVEVADEAMESGDRKTIYKGEHVYIDPDREYETNTTVAALVAGFPTLIIRKYRVTSINEDGKPLFDLVAPNPDYPSIPNAHERDARIVGRVIAKLHIFD